MLNQFHPVYHDYTYLAGSRVDIERLLEPELDMDDVEDLIDILSEPSQFFERLSPVSTTIGDQHIRGRNWTDMMIKCYRVFGRTFLRATSFLRQALINEHNEHNMVPFMSMSVDPDTLARLIEFDYEAGENSYLRLMQLYENGAVAPAMTTPFHCVLPLLRSDFDRRLCVRLSLLFFRPIINTYKHYLDKAEKKILTVGMWLPEAVACSSTLKIIHEEFFAFCEEQGYENPHLVLLMDADSAEAPSLDRQMKSWCKLKVEGKELSDTTVVFRDPAFSNWLMTSHPSIKKIIDRTIAKVDNQLTEEKVHYTWAHFESIEALTYSPRDGVNFEQRILKLCELGYLSISPDTYVRRKLNGEFGVAKKEPLTVKFIEMEPAKDPIGAESRYGRWRGFGYDKDGKRAVMPNQAYTRKTAKGKDKRQGSPCWKIAWNLTAEKAFEFVGGDPDKMKGGALEMLAKLTGMKSKASFERNVESFLLEYGLIYWREHFIQHDLSEADIRIDDIAKRTLRKGSRKQLKPEELAAAACAAQAYYFLLDSCNSYGLDCENLDQRGMFQNSLMLTLAYVNMIAASHYLGKGQDSEQYFTHLEEHLFNFGEAYDRFDLKDYGVSKQAWNKAMQSEVNESKMNVVERASRRTATRHLMDFGYEDRFTMDDEEMTTNVGHVWSVEVDIPNYEWANAYFCGVKEA